MGVPGHLPTQSLDLWVPELEGTEASHVPVSSTVPVFEHKEEDEEISGVGGAGCLSVLMPTSGWEVFFKQARDELRCLPA